MAQQTTMTIYQDIVLECQHCYMICRSSEAEVRHSCPSCGRAIANWEAVTKAIRKSAPQPQGSTTKP